MRLVLDTNVYSFAPESKIERLAARGFLISVSEIALVEALAKSRRDYLSGVLTKERARGKFFARARKLAQYIDPQCPVALGLAGVMRRIIAETESTSPDPVAEQHAEFLNSMWYSVTTLDWLDDIWLDNAQTSETWLTERDETLRLVVGTVRAQDKPTRWATMNKVDRVLSTRVSIATFWSLTEALIERLHAHVATVAHRIYGGGDGTLSPKTNDGADLHMTQHLAASCILVTEDGPLIEIVDAAGTYQAPWVRSLDDLNELPEGPPWGESARAQARSFKRKPRNGRRSRSSLPEEILFAPLVDGFRQVMEAGDAADGAENRSARVRETVEVFRKLMAMPVRPRHASRLEKLSIQIREQDPQAALATASEAVAIARILVTEVPTAYRPLLSSTLNTLANARGAARDYQGALDAAKESLAVAREIVALDPSYFRADLALVLSNVAGRLSEVGDMTSARSAAEESVSLYRAAAAEGPSLLLPLASALYGLGSICLKAGDSAHTINVCIESVNLMSAAVGHGAKESRHQLIMALQILGEALWLSGDRPGAILRLKEEILLTRDLVQDAPIASLPLLARALGNLSSKLEVLGDREDAIRTRQEATDMYRELHATQPAAMLGSLTLSLTGLAAMLTVNHQFAAAIPVARDAIDFCSRARTSHAEMVAAMRPIADEALIESCAMENEVASIEPAVREAIEYAGTLVTVESAACLTRLETNLRAVVEHVGEAAAGALKRALEEVRAERSAASSRHHPKGEQQ